MSEGIRSNCAEVFSVFSNSYAMQSTVCAAVHILSGAESIESICRCAADTIEEMCFNDDLKCSWKSIDIGLTLPRAFNELMTMN